MGIFSYYLGEMDIPEADRPEYARQALAILRAGGMMSVEQIHLCGKSMYLLFPPEFDEKGEASGYYNYLDNQSWEPWKLSTENGVFWSNKIGGNCFYHTIIAVNILSSLWAKSYGAATVDGRLVKEEPYHQLIRASTLSSGQNKRWHCHRPRLAPASLRPLPRQRSFLLAGKSFGVFRERKRRHGEADEAAGLSPGNEENEGGCCFHPEKPWLPLSTDGISAGSTACWERPIQTGGLHRFGLWKSCCIRRTNVQNITVI